VSHIKLKPKELIQQLGTSGFYTLLAAEGKAYLSTCVNAQGPTTVTREQFLANRTAYDLKPNRLLPILIG
jgi:cyanosortase A-associated protein